MAHLHVKTPNGTTYSIDLDATAFDWVSNSYFTDSITSNPNFGSGWCRLPNDLILIFGFGYVPNNNFGTVIYLPLSITKAYTLLATDIQTSSDAISNMCIGIQSSNNDGVLDKIILMGNPKSAGEVTYLVLGK